MNVDNLNDPLIQSRVATMGELSSGIIHDLYTPLQNLKLCCEILKRDPSYATKEDFIQDISSAVEQTVTIVDAIRHFLRSPKAGDNRSFQDLFENILVILKPKYPNTNLTDLFTIDPQLATLPLPINASTAIHILFNIFKIIISNLVDNASLPPIITIKLTDIEGQAGLMIFDNQEGAGLTRFTTIERKGKEHWQEDLSLWLVQELVSKTNGELKVVQNSEAGAALVWRITNAGIN